MGKSVCFIGGGLTIGGQEKALVKIANSLADKGIQVSIVLIMKTPVEIYINPDIRVFFPTFERKNINKYIYIIKSIFYLRKKIKYIKPDCTVCIGDWFNSFTIIATLGLSQKLLITNRMGPNLNLGIVVESLNKIFYRFADRLIVQTSAAADIQSKKYKIRKVEIIPNFIDDQLLSCSDTIIKKRKQIISVGRLSKEKGHIVLLKAFSKLIQDDWELHLVGDGPERLYLEKVAYNLQISERVVFHGVMKNFETLLKTSEIFVLPSFYEGFPNALLEALSLNVCCIASNCVAGPSDIIKNEINGYLFEPGNVEQLQNLLNKLIKDNQLRLSISKGSKNYLDNFNRDEILKMWNKVLF